MPLFASLTEGPQDSDYVGCDPLREEIRRLLSRQGQALRAGNSSLYDLLGTACERLAGELSSRHSPCAGAALSCPPRPRETQADFGDFAR